MNVTLPAWCFAKARVVDCELFAAIFKRASLTMYVNRSRHDEKTTGTEKQMQWAQMFVAYKHCRSVCSESIRSMSHQFEKDMKCISERRTGGSSKLLSVASGLRSEGRLAELDKFIDDMTNDGANVVFDDSMEAEAECTASHDVSDANANLSRDLLGKVSVAKFLLLELSRDPKLLHDKLMEGDELCVCRDSLQQRDLQVQLPSGTKMFVRPETYEYALQIATSQSLRPRHVLLEPDYEDAFLRAIASLPSKKQIRVKSKGDEHIVLAEKKFRGDGWNSSSDDDVEEVIEWTIRRTFVEVPFPSCDSRLTKSA
jgi:hypothetical protein